MTLKTLPFSNNVCQVECCSLRIPVFTKVLHCNLFGEITFPLYVMMMSSQVVGVCKFLAHTGYISMYDLCGLV